MLQSMQNLRLVLFQPTLRVIYMNTPSPQSRLPTVILLLVATLAVPSVAAWAFAGEITQHPWQAVGLALVYEMLVLIAGFITQVWQKLQSRWVDRVAENLDAFAHALDPGYQRRYLAHLGYRHRNFDVKGLGTQGIYTLELQRVFVELRIAPKPLNKMSTDPIPPLPQELRGQHPIWDYVHSPTLKKLAVIGPPGSGKSTLLKHMTLTLAAGFKLRRQLPILLFLRDHSSKISQDANYPLETAISENLTQKDGPLAPTGWFTQQLKAGHCLVLLDGLDEVADATTRQRVVAWVEKQMVAYPLCRFVITSRPHGYRSNPLEGVTMLEVQSFNLKQIEQFVHNWYHANEMMSAGKDDPGVRMEAETGARDLLARLRKTPTLAALAVNPLLLTMIATVHRYRSSLPGRRVELYAEVCEVFLGKRQAAKGLSQDLTPAQKQRVLQVLAYHLMQQKSREFRLAEMTPIIAKPLALVTGKGDKASAEIFLKAVENESGLLLERESGEYSFAHLAFQEYLAAVHVREQRLEQTLVAQVHNPWWHETIRLYCAQADASPIVAACLAADLPPVPALTLAIECVEEAKEVDPALRLRLEALLTEGVEGSDE